MWLPLLRSRRRGIPCKCFRHQLVLAMSKKHDLSVVDYFRKIKGLVTKLTVASSTLRDDDVIAYLLVCLGPDYDPFVSSMTTKSEALTLDDVFAHLMAFEARQLQHQVELQLNPGSSVNYAGHGGQQKNRGRRDCGRGRL